jgi:hypothetical protein
MQNCSTHLLKQSWIKELYYYASAQSTLMRPCSLRTPSPGSEKKHRENRFPSDSPTSGLRNEAR